MKQRSLLFLACTLLSLQLFAANAPSNLNATAVSSSQVSLTWTDNSSDEVGFTFAFDTNPAFTSPTYVWTGGANVTSYQHTGLTRATTYYYKIKAEGNPDSSWTSVDAATTAPSSLSATAVSDTQINVSWTGNAGNANLTGYTVAKATNSSFTGATYHFVNGAGATSYSSTGLSAGTTYYFKVKAEGTSDAYDSPFTAAVSATTGQSGIPNSPSGLTASATSSSRVDLSWIDNSNNETGFELKRATDSAFTQNVIWIGGISGTTYGNTGLTASTTYYYKVRAEGTAGKSAYSNTVSVTTPPGATVTEGVPISPRFFGINAWMPCAVGSDQTNGKLGQKWPQVQASGVRSVRYGGITVDNADPNAVAPSDCHAYGTNTREQYAKIIDAIRGIGAEPIIQVPVKGGQRMPEEAAALVEYINITLQKGVKYWSIGNEPDLKYPDMNAGDIATYIRNFSAAMKAKDASIKIVAPETAWFNWGNVLDPLTSTHDITGRNQDTNLFWIDVFSFHTYPYPKSDGTWPSRSEVIGKLASFDANLTQLKQRIAARNAAHNRTGDQAITIAVTEANINHRNRFDDNLDGVGATSFLGGQFWAEMLGVAMLHGVDFFNFWSVIEGNSNEHDKGYLCRDGVSIHPSYEHFKMMATHFRGNAIKPNRGDAVGSVKTFASKATDQASVILINQDGSASFSYTVVLNGSAASGDLRVNVPANMSGQATGTIAAQSTILLVFDSAGVLKRKIEYKRFGPNNQPSLTDVPY